MKVEEGVSSYPVCSTECYLAEELATGTRGRGSGGARVRKDWVITLKQDRRGESERCVYRKSSIVKGVETRKRRGAAVRNVQYTRFRRMRIDRDSAVCEGCSGVPWRPG